jgi:hypothetical protein
MKTLHKGRRIHAIRPKRKQGRPCFNKKDSLGTVQGTSPTSEEKEEKQKEILLLSNVQLFMKHHPVTGKKVEEALGLLRPLSCASPQ